MDSVKLRENDPWNRSPSQVRAMDDRLSGNGLPGRVPAVRKGDEGPDRDPEGGLHKPIS
jgi:hypothetical protein